MSSDFDSVPLSPPPAFLSQGSRSDLTSEASSLERPSLQLQDVEGRIHKYEGMLSRKTKKAKLKNGWKRRWFRVIPDHHQQNLYNLSQSKFTVRNNLKLQKLIITRIPRTEPDIVVSALSQDAGSHDFTSFVVRDSRSDVVLGTFHADDIVQQRNFMAALGGSGPGLFTQRADDTLEEENLLELEQMDGILQKECELEARHLIYDSRLNNCNTDNLPSYEWSMNQLPKEFYFPQDYRNDSEYSVANFSGSEIPVYDPTASISQPARTGEAGSPLLPLHHRKVTDTFLPPHGTTSHCLVSIGYGKEAGLEPHQQAVWDTQNAFYYFLDHSTKSSSIQDPRPLDKPDKMTELKKGEHTYNGSPGSDFPMPVICGDCIAVAKSADRAAGKPHGFVLKSFGRNGSDGGDGWSGPSGETGRNGTLGVNGDGTDGISGDPGASGARGRDGKKGGNGGDLVVQLSGDTSLLNLRINDQCSATARLGGDQHKEVVFVDCRGGNGGHGGEGGMGGAGGCGGDGGKGGRNGDGGHGGDGGMGGEGGNGGIGGMAGSGGRCVIRTPDPRLLMLVEVDCRTGEQGMGGAGGNGGEGGRRGYGGEGGVWTESDVSPNAAEGSVVEVQGMNGKPGSTGSDGTNGRTGLDGQPGEAGGLLWVVESSPGEVLYEAGMRYEAIVTSLQVSPAMHDNVYEPNQAITVSKVVVRNNGGLPLPKGAKLFFPSTKTVRFESSIYELPEILPNNSITISEHFSGRIFDQSTPNYPGPFSGEASFSPQIELLSRPFENVLTHTVSVAYPVNLSFALSRKDIGRGEISVLEVGVENTSTVTYGSASDCGGSVSVRLHLDSQLIPLGIQQTSPKTGEREDEEALSFQVTHDPNLRDSIWVTVKELQPGALLTIPIAFLIDPSAQLCDTYVWQSALYFKGKLVEYLSQEVRVTPAYTPPSSPKSLGDVLMVTSEMISGPEFVLWQRIFDILDVNVDYWDANKRNDLQMPPEERTVAETSHPTSGARGASSTSSSPTGQDMPSSPIFTPFRMYAGKTIIYPHCKLEELSPECIASHFNTPSSSMLVFQPSSTPCSLEDYHYDHTGHAKLLRHLCSSQDRLQLSDDTHSGYHLLTPGTLISPDVAVKKSEEKVMKRLEVEYPTRALALFSSRYNINQKSLLKYTYGVMDVRRCPLQRSCNFQCVDGVGGSLAAMGVDDPLLTAKSKEFPLASKFGQVFLAVLVSIPLHCKLNLFKTTETKSSSHKEVKFYLPNGRHLNKQQLSAIAVAHAVADEVMDCNISRMVQVMKDLQTNKSLYSKNGSAVVLNQMVSLIQLEAAERAKRLNSPAVTSAVRQIQQLCRSFSILNTSHSSQDRYPGSIQLAARLNSLPVTIRPNPCMLTARTLSCPGTAATPSPGSYSGSMFNLPMHADTTAADHGLQGLPSLGVLQDSSHVLRSHQLTVKEGCYSIA